jgi:two-component system, cell cycle sensor histidine kinase and response regulator CckA
MIKMNINNLEQEFERAQNRLHELQFNADGSQKILQNEQQETISELSIALEELRVTIEEIQQQNEELLVTRRQVEFERQRYQELFDLAPDGYILTDENGVIQESNLRVAQLLNIPQKYLPGKPLDIFISQQARNVFNSQWSKITSVLFEEQSQKIASNNEKKDRYTRLLVIDNSELHLQPRDKEPFPVLFSVSITWNDRTDRVNLLWLLRDWRDRKKAEEQIREQATLLNITTDAIIVSDLSGKILFWNKAAEKLYGWTKEEIIGQQIDRLLDIKSVAKAISIQSKISNKGNWHGELNQITKTGEQIIVESRCTLIRDLNDRPKSILIVNTDITLIKELQEQSMRKQRMESVGVFASAMAHDFNNILTPILGLAQLLPSMLGNASDREKELFKIIETNVRRGTNLLKQILLFVRGATGQRESLQLSLLLSEVKQLIVANFPKSIELENNVGCDLKTIYGDVTQLHQVFMNLCLNARDAMPEGGTLTVSAENFALDETYAQMESEARVGPYVVVTVKDTGVGIPPENMARIFEPFFTTKEVGKGTGFGLATAMGIVKSHGGFIQVSSELDKGTEFKVFLPAQETEATYSEEDRDFPQGNQELILIVDEEVSICQVAQTALSRYNYRVLTAGNGVDAIAIYLQHQHEINAVVMDLKMPSMDGMMAVRTLQEINPQVKIILSSGTNLDNWAHSSIDHKIRAFLSKPYTATELLTTLHEII